MLESKYEQLVEGYRDFKSGDDKPSKKIKSTIQEIAKKLQEIETLVNYNSKLKTESGVTSSAYGPSTTKALTKISERLIKISERIRSLGE
jgi:CHASE3 domain sensor protein